MNKRLIITGVASLFLSIILGVSGVLLAIATVKKYDTKEISSLREITSFNKLTIDINAKIDIRQGEKDELLIRAGEEYIEKIKTEVIGDTLRISDSNKYKTRLFDFGESPSTNIILTVKQLDTIELDGLTQMTINSLNTDSLSLILKGIGDTNIKNVIANTMTINREGVNEITATGLEVQNLTVNSQSVGDITIQELKGNKISVNLHGTGDFTSSGIVEEFNLNTNGTGDINNQHLHAKIVNVIAKGTGDMQISALEQLNIQKTGYGDVIYYGKANLNKSVEISNGELVYGGDIVDKE